MKTENVDLKKLWKDKPLITPAQEEIFQKTFKLKSEIRNRSILMILVLLATMVVIFMIWFNSDRISIASNVAVTLFVIAISFGIVNFIKSAAQSIQKDVMTDANTYLKQMLAMRQHQELSQTKILTTYFGWLTVAFGFYVYGATSQMELMSQVVTWVITFGWLAFVWFYMRPRAIQKQKEKFDSVITKLQNICSTLASD